MAAEAEALWTLLARVLPEPWRAEALVLLAVYVRGDGSLAGIAVLAALADDAEHPMAPHDTQVSACPDGRGGADTVVVLVGQDQHCTSNRW
jgi:hypothetical protein